MEVGEGIDIDAQSVLLAASQHDVAKLKNLLKTASVSVQDPETGVTPLHAAVAALEPDEDEDPPANGERLGKKAGPTDGEREKELEIAAETVRLLFLNGAIWNDLDKNNETPGCIAYRLSLEEIYGIIVDAGVRAELLLSKLDEYEVLDDEDDEDEENMDMETAAGFSNQDSTTEVEPATAEDVSKDNSTYLANPLSFDETAILDASQNGVMMSWETPLMQKHADLLAPKGGLRVLNIGHGLGIIDAMFQEKKPAAHHIVEAHPSVITRMREQGWMDKPGVTVHEGRWQDVLPQLVMGDEDGHEIVFDAIYFDTFAEDYKALREFFSEWVVQFMGPEGRFAFFNGMGADRQICYDVYTKVRVCADQESQDDVIDISRWSNWILTRPVWTSNGKTSIFQISKKQGNGKE
jgi:protein arginine N-methyltransferase 2